MYGLFNMQGGGHWIEGLEMPVPFQPVLDVVVCPCAVRGLVYPGIDKRLADENIVAVVCRPYRELGHIVLTFYRFYRSFGADSGIECDGGVSGLLSGRDFVA